MISLFVLINFGAVARSDLLQLAQLFFKVLDFLLLLGDPVVTFLFFHAQLLDDVAMLQLLLGQFLT